jgi:hypothetical protein
MARFIAFETAIAKSKFKITGIVEEKDLIVVEDTSKVEGEDGKYHEIDVLEIIEKPIDQLLRVLSLERPPIVLNGITRIVGYYSRVDNWNKSKVGELRDRVRSRYEGGYGFNGTDVNLKAYNDALAVVNNK